MEAKKLDESGVNSIFDMFDELKDKIKRIEVGGSSFMKAFLTHKCFEPTVSRARSLGRQSAENDEVPGRLRGVLFGAKVYYDHDLPNGTIRVYGQESQEAVPDDPAGSKYSFELTFQA